MQYKVLPILLVLFCFFIKGCSSSDSESDPEQPDQPDKIILTVDKTACLADGQDGINLTVKNSKGEDVSATCSFKASNTSNGTEIILDKSFFTTTQSGSYALSAQCGDLRSNDVLINAASPGQVNYTIVADRTELLADGGDLITLRMMSEEGKDMTSLGTFFVNDKKIDGNVFKTTKTGSHTVSAKIGSTTITGKLIIEAVAQMSFTHRILMEYLTGTWCPNCPAMTTKLKDLTKLNDKIIVVGIHLNGTTASQRDPWYINATDDLQRYFGNPGLPHVRINRATSAWDGNNESALDKILDSSSIGIAIESQQNGDQLDVTARLVSENPVGSINYVIELVEDKLVEVKKSYDWVLRDVKPSIFGDNLSLEAFTPVDRKVSFSLAGKNLANCRIVVIACSNSSKAIRNVQVVSAGKNIGYK